ncbi:hypothetical protein GGF48_005587, partial [Coemansia sp. RSA 921]
MAASSKLVGRQNLAVTLLTAYLSVLARQPLVTKACTTATLNFLQEEIAQRSSGMRADESRDEARAKAAGRSIPKSIIERIVNKRVLQFALYGL